MKQRIASLLSEQGIDCFGFLPLDACAITKPYLLEKENITSGSVAIFAVPYYTHACDQSKNLSAYAVAKDYHLFFQELFQTLLGTLSLEFPDHQFAAFSDHSPIDERLAAAMAGLGIIGKNHLLITKKYASYVFLGEIVTDAELGSEPTAVSHCTACGACLEACPFLRGERTQCLSALTQKKGSLTEDERALIAQHDSVWGCDICQEVCPYTKNAKKSGTIYSPISYFEEDVIPNITSSTLLDMDKDAFALRAYSWRGKEVILRNLTLG